MDVVLILSVIKALLSFPKELKEFIQYMEKTPSEKRDDIMKRVRGDSSKSADTGRPVWEDLD